MKYYIIIALLIISSICFAQDFKPNYQESAIPDYQLPDLLLTQSGDQVTTSEQWKNIRRKEILEDFEQFMYGKIPKEKIEAEIEKYETIDVFEGTATMKEVKISFSGNNQNIEMKILIFLPKTKAKAPLFIGYNFYGNHTISDEPGIFLTTSWVRNNAEFGITENKATASSRGIRQNRWAVKKILDRGYGLATIYYGDIDPDKNDFSDGIHPLFYKSNQTHPDKDEWGSIGAWAWGMSRAMDYFEVDDKIDESKVVLMGHSRLGKTSLWAGAMDQRFAIVISNNSGCGGAALSRRRIGETVWRINTAFPHWFCDNFKQFSNNEGQLPVDQHMLIALMAPRPVYVASAQDDKWADPKGEFLSAFYAGAVYNLFGLNGIPNNKMPQVNKPIMETVGYHIRTGKHDVTDFDWEAYLDFADKHIKGH